MSTGAADDIAKASAIARSMVVRFGMDTKLGQVAYEPDNATALGMPAGTDWRPRQYAEQTAAAIDAAVRELIDAAFQRALTVLRENRSLLDQAARDLLAKETMSAEDLQVLARCIGAGARACEAA